MGMALGLLVAVLGGRGFAVGSARSPGNPRARHLTREHVPLADVLEGYPTISRVK